MWVAALSTKANVINNNKTMKLGLVNYKCHIVCRHRHQLNEHDYS